MLCPIYVFRDTAVSGPQFGAGASPSAIGAMVSAARDLDLEATADGVRFELLADQIGALGGGSDYAPFLNHLGVASLNFGFDMPGGHPVDQTERVRLVPLDDSVLEQRSTATFDLLLGPLTRTTQLHVARARSVWHALRSAHAYWMVVGACNPLESYVRITSLDSRLLTSAFILVSRHPATPTSCVTWPARGYGPC